MIEYDRIPEWKRIIIDEVTQFINRCFIIDREDITKVRVVVFPYKDHGKIYVKYWCNENCPIMISLLSSRLIINYGKYFSIG